MKTMLAQALTGVYKQHHKLEKPHDDRMVGNKIHVHKKHLDKQHTPDEIRALATLIRKEIILMLLEAESGHSAGPLGMADVFASLYFAVLKHDPRKPNWEERDRVIMSNGHICPVLYATLAECGYFSKTELGTLRKLGSRLQGHPHFQANNNHKNKSENNLKHPSNLPGIENSSGPLGQGLSQAIGVATALKMNQKTNYVYAFMSDGELQEGQNWEAFLYAANKKLNNLTVLIDRNGIQIDGYTEQILPLESVIDKLKSFNWNVYSINGHRIETIIQTLKIAKQYRLGPSVIICQTIPGKDVDFMENLPEWHGKPPNKKQTKDALADLRSLKGRIWWE
jgi:transketolase